MRKFPLSYHYSVQEQFSQLAIEENKSAYNYQVLFAHALHFYDTLNRTPNCLY